MKGELLKLSGSLMLVHGVDVPELSGEVMTMLGWCDSALKKNTESKRVSIALCLKGVAREICNGTEQDVLPNPVMLCPVNYRISYFLGGKFLASRMLRARTTLPPDLIARLEIHERWKEGGGGD